MPRPRRDPDEQLARELDELVAEFGSVRRVAMAFRLHPTTLQRSLDQRSFSQTTSKNVRLNWNEALIVLGRPRSPHAPKTPRETLHLMRKLNRLLSGAIAELEAAIGSK